MPADRVAALEQIAKASPYWGKTDSAEMQQRHDLMRAKLIGFLDRSDTVARRYPLNDHSLAARYARAIATFKQSDINKALHEIDELIQAQPGNPYFHELKGQALLESGRGAEAAAPLRRAAQLSPNPALIQIMLAQALISTNNTKVADEAVSLLRSALTREPEAAGAYAQLAMAYGRKGDVAHADLASAEAAFYRGDYPAATMLATRAKTRLPVGSPAWVRADDIVSAKAKTKAN
jgi:predicted Zn-dependent protease